MRSFWRLGVALSTTEDGKCVDISRTPFFMTRFPCTRVFLPSVSSVYFPICLSVSFRFVCLSICLFPSLCGAGAGAGGFLHPHPKHDASILTLPWRRATFVTRRFQLNSCPSTATARAAIFPRLRWATAAYQGMCSTAPETVQRLSLPIFRPAARG